MVEHLLWPSILLYKNVLSRWRFFYLEVLKNNFDTVEVVVTRYYLLCVCLSGFPCQLSWVGITSHRGEGFQF